MEIFAGLTFFAILIGFAIYVGLIVLWVWNLVEALKFTDHQWNAVGQNKVLWLIILIGSFLVGFGLVGSILYMLIPRPALRRTAGYR